MNDQRTDRRAAATRRLTLSMLIDISGYAMANATIAVLVNQIIEEYSLTAASQGLMAGMAGLGATLSVLMVPLLQGRVKKSAMLCFSSITMALMMALSGFAGNFALLLAAGTLQGAAGGWTDAYTNSSIVDINPGGAARYLGALHGFYGLGSIMTPLLVQGLLYVTGWRNVYLLLSLLSAVIAAQFILSLRAWRAAHGDAAEPQEPRLQLRELGAFLKDGANITLMLALFFHTASQTGLVNWAVRYMSVTYDAESLGSLAVSVYWICTTLSRFVVPRLPLSHYRQLLWGFVAGGVLHVGGVLLGNPWAVVVASGLVGVTTGCGIPLLMSVCLARYPGRTTLPTSALVLLLRLASFVTPLAVAAVSALSMGFSMILSGLCSLAAAVFVVLFYRVTRGENGG